MVSLQILRPCEGLTPKYLQLALLAHQLGWGCEPCGWTWSSPETTEVPCFVPICPSPELQNCHIRAEIAFFLEQLSLEFYILDMWTNWSIVDWCYVWYVSSLLVPPEKKKREHHPQKYPLWLPWLISLLLLLVCIALVTALLGEYVQPGYRREVWGKCLEKSREIRVQRAISCNQEGAFTQEQFYYGKGC